MIAPNISEFIKRGITSIILLTCFGGAYLHSSTLFVIFLIVIVGLMLTTEWPHVITVPPLMFLGISAIYPLLPFLILIWLTLTYRSTDFFLPLYPFFVAWKADTCGYLVGKLWGEHKICPSISPGKSWEGLIGSLLGVFVVHLFLIRHIHHFEKLNSIGYAIALTISMTTISFLGGLWLSWLKRRQGLKDAGSLLPGHGGLMDRFDSVMFVAVGTAVLIFLTR